MRGSARVNPNGKKILAFSRFDKTGPRQTPVYVTFSELAIHLHWRKRERSIEPSFLGGKAHSETTHH